MAGGDENAPQDMGALITNIGAIRSYTNAHVAVVHHGTKNPNGSTPRGHGSLIGAADMVVEVAKSDGMRTATVTAANDHPEGARLAMSFSRSAKLEMGTDEDGDPITTCLVQETDGEPVTAQRPKEAKLRDQPALMLRELRNLMLNLGRAYVTHSWRPNRHRGDPSHPAQAAHRSGLVHRQSALHCFGWIAATDARRLRGRKYRSIYIETSCFVAFDRAFVWLS